MHVTVAFEIYGTEIQKLVRKMFLGMYMSVELIICCVCIQKDTISTHGLFKILKF